MEMKTARTDLVSFVDAVDLLLGKQALAAQPL
jgi:hypothetical protein